MGGCWLPLGPAMQPPPIGNLRQVPVVRVQHCAAIWGWRMLVEAPGTSSTEVTCSMPGRRQKVVVVSRSPPSMTSTPVAGMAGSEGTGGGVGTRNGDGGDACAGGVGGGESEGGFGGGGTWE